MVLQRTTQNVSAAAVSGQCSLAGQVEARVTRKGRVVAGWDWKRIGSAKGRKLAGFIRGLPVGGPYAVILRIRSRSGEFETADPVDDVLVGDVWVLAGQSNMEGVGWLRHALKPRDEVRAFYMDNTWGAARDPLHNLWSAHAPVHGGDPTTSRLIKDRPWAVGPGVSFGQDMARSSGVPQGLIACAHGGTSMPQWDPANKRLGGGSLYGAMVERVRLNGGRVRGVLWYQGCSDANPDGVAHYIARMKKLVAAMRRDFRDPALPVVMVQIGRFFFGAGNGEHWNAIQECQRRLPAMIGRLALVPVVDLPMDDGIHLGGDGQNVLGRRLAYAMRVLVQGRKAGLPPIEVESIVGDLDIRRFLYTVTVTFRNVAGSLQAKGEPSGFNHFGFPNKVFRVTLKGNQAILNVSGIESEMRERGLQYGYGFQPYCNITDGVGRPVPVFGPLPIDMRPSGRFRIMTECKVQCVQADGMSVAGIGCPTDWAGAVACTRMAFDTHTPFKAWEALHKPVAGVAFYRSPLDVSAGGRVTLHLGYDGPVKVWCDGRVIWRDERGCRPATPVDAAVKLTLAKGTHDLVVAQGARGGGATGVFVILEQDGRL